MQVTAWVQLVPLGFNVDSNQSRARLCHRSKPWSPGGVPRGQADSIGHPHLGRPSRGFLGCAVNRKQSPGGSNPITLAGPDAVL